MSNKTKVASVVPPVQEPAAEEFPFKNGIGIIQSSLILLACLSMLEVGFIYTTLIIYVLMAVAFYEMLQV
jgi:hypothetical protein